jgi:anti-sigma regulatory factor (Ser/Thr protein kinase)
VGPADHDASPPPDPPGRSARAFPARLAAFADVRAFIADVCSRAALARGDCLRVTLLVEELFTNTVVHGHGAECDELVHLTLEVGPQRLAVVYEDCAPPHDPLASAAPPADAVELMDRPEGGIGLALVSGLAREASYAYVEGRNRIRLVLVPSS